MTTLFYLFIILSLSFCVVSKQGNAKILPILCLAELILVSVLRYDVGDDYQTYIEYYDRVKTFDDYLAITGSFEYISFLIIKLSFILGNSFYLFAIYAIATYMFIVKAAQRYHINIIAVLLFYVLSSYYFVSFNQIRQACSMAIILFASNYIYERNFIRYLGFCVLAGSIHISAMVFILLYPIAIRHYSFKFLLLMYIFSFALAGLVERTVVSILGSLNVYSLYLGDNDWLKGNGLAVLKNIIPNIIFLTTLFKLNRLVGNERFIFLLFSLSVFYFNMFAGKNIFIRPGMYLDLFLILFLPIYIQRKIVPISKMSLLVCFIMYYTTLLIFTIFAGGGQGVVPYKTIVYA